MLPFSAVYVAGAVAFWQRPGHVAAQRLLASGAFMVVGASLGHFISLGLLAFGAGSWFWLANALMQVALLLGAASSVALFAVFPDGRHQRAYESWAVRAHFAAAPLLPLALLVSLPDLRVDTFMVWTRVDAASPFYLPALAGLGPPIRGYVDARFLFVPVAVVLAALRYRRFGPEERLRLRWPLSALALLSVLPIAKLSVDYGLAPPWLLELTFTTLYALLAASLVVGMLRHRLFDIDAVIRGSAVYAALWLAIGVAYVGAAAALGTTAGERLPVGAAILLTIAATIAFRPLRDRLTALADRRVFGERLAGEELLMRLGATLERGGDAAELAAAFADAVRKVLGVAWTRVSLGDAVAVAGTGEGPAALSGALAHDDEVLGRIECGPKLRGRFTEADRELLRALGRQAAVAFRTSRLAAELALRLDELAASRARIVQAQEVERRRVERDIHDGVQQQVVALIAKLRLTRNRLARDPANADVMLAELQEDARLALEDLRELAKGIHPAVLSDRGLIDAIEARAARLPIGVTIDTDGLARGARYPTDIESAAYFVVSEGLANVLKHASAARATVRLSRTTDALRVEIADEGRGFAPDEVPRSGLIGLQDRVEALGGRLEVLSAPGAGARLVARLPARERDA